MSWCLFSNFRRIFCLRSRADVPDDHEEGDFPRSSNTIAQSPSLTILRHAASLVSLFPMSRSILISALRLLVKEVIKFLAKRLVGLGTTWAAKRIEDRRVEGPDTRLKTLLIWLVPSHT